MAVLTNAMSATLAAVGVNSAFMEWVGFVAALLLTAAFFLKIIFKRAFLIPDAGS